MIIAIFRLQLSHWEEERNKDREKKSNLKGKIFLFKIRLTGGVIPWSRKDKNKDIQK